MRIASIGTLAALAVLIISGCDSARSVAQEEGCTQCHGNPPPPGTGGQTDPTDPHVGAHQRHMTGGTFSNPFACGTCHTVPTDLSHLDGNVPVDPKGAGQRQLPADLGTYTPAGQTCAVYCHGSGTPALVGGTNPTPTWTDAGQLACNACHGTRPASGLHTFAPHSASPCAFCHLGYTEGTTVDLALHVSGVKDVVFLAKDGVTTAAHTTGWTDCSGCHDANFNH